MRGLIIIAFFSIFAVASLLIPTPMFPGSWLCAAIGPGAMAYIGILSAIFNGVIYGSILWLIFSSLSKKLTK